MRKHLLQLDFTRQNDGAALYAQYPVAQDLQNPFKLCFFACNSWKRCCIEPAEARGSAHHASTIARATRL